MAKNTRTSLFEWDESGGVGGSNSRTAVANRLVCDGEIAQVVTNHLWLDLDTIEGLAVVHTDHRSNHLWHNDHVAEVGLDTSRALTLRGS